MPNIRILNDNAISRASSVTGSTEASADLGVANLLDLEQKSKFWRTTGTSATLTLVWSAAETIGALFLPFCNFTTAATVRLRGYTNSGDATPVFDTGNVLACRASVPNPLGSNYWAYGGGTRARVWVAVPKAVKKLVVDIVDTGNPAGYLEMAFAACGSYFSPSVNPAWGAPAGHVDTSSQYRAGGNLNTSVNIQYRKQGIDYKNLAPTDRTKMDAIAQASGLRKPIMVSLYPESSDYDLEHAGEIYAKFKSNPVMSHPAFREHATSWELEEV